MKVLVCGGRDYADKQRVFQVLNYLHISELCHGGAKGADSLAGSYAFYKGMIPKVYKADWNKHGLAAGPIRNGQMLVEFKPDLVVAFPGGKGTIDMVKQARAAKVPVLEVPC